MKPAKLSAETEKLMAKLVNTRDMPISDLLDEGIVRDIVFHWGEAMTRLENLAILLEAEPDNIDAMAEIRRTLHTIKGDAGMAGMAAVSDVFHQTENLLEQYLSEKTGPTEMLLRIRDWLQQFLDGMSLHGPGENRNEPEEVSGHGSGLGRDCPAPPKNRMKILIAENDVASCSRLRSILTQWGFDVVITGDGNQAFAAFQQKNAPRLALLDFGTTGLDGPALCRKLRAQVHHEPLYLILLVSQNHDSDIDQGLDAGADDYIPRICSDAELHARINLGCRMIALENEMHERKRLQDVLAAAGAVCHDLNQPLQRVSGFSELMLMDVTTGDPNHQHLQSILEGIDRIGELARKIMRITRYQTRRDHAHDHTHSHII